MKVLYLLMILSLVACKETGKETKETPAEGMDEETMALLSHFKELPADTLRVYSPDFQNTDDAFYGEPLDSTHVSTFPEPFYPAPESTTGYFACYQFAIGTHTVGLIVRTPAMYVSSSVKLFVYDIPTKKVTSSMELAESWGDAGDIQEKEAFILRSNQNGVEVLLWDSQSHDNSIENPADTTITTRDRYYRVQVSSQLDTLSDDTATLQAAYKQLNHE